MDDDSVATQVLLTALKNFEFIRNVKFDSSSGERIITSEFTVNMPSRAQAKGESASGIKIQELVFFYLPKYFPLKSPIIKLRKDFPCNFPHLNPSKEHEVLPCVYEGDIDELYQNANGPYLLIFQIKDWLEKAAKGELIDPNQGWEPMRADTRNGLIEISSAHLDTARTEHSKHLVDGNAISTLAIYEENKGFVFAQLATDKTDAKNNSHTRFLIFETNSTIEQYIPSALHNLNDLIDLADLYNIHSIKAKIDHAYQDFPDDYRPSILLVALAIKRPYNVINPHHTSNYEYLFFAIHCKSKGREKKELYEGSRVSSLFQIESVSTALLKQLSGHVSNNTTLLFVGCGSVGSKLALHLAKAGCDNFSLIDPDIFFPHNNARHGAVSELRLYKTDIVGDMLLSLKRNIFEISHKSIMDYQFDRINQTDLIIDSTASLAVRNFLSVTKTVSPVISVSLFNHSRMGLILIEDADRNTRVDDLAAHCYAVALKNQEFAKHYINHQISNQRIGLGCSSYTTVCSDADISLVVAGMANKIHNLATNGLPKQAQICFGIVSDDNMSIIWDSIDIEPTVVIKAINPGDMEIRIIGNIAKTIRKDFQANLPNETGGVLVGHVSLPQQKIYITSLIEAPDDSKRSPSFFELGTNELSEIIQSIDNQNTPIKALGTWHTHPQGGGPSQYDKNTKRKIERVLGKESTCCLIFSETGFHRF